MPTDPTTLFVERLLLDLVGGLGLIDPNRGGYATLCFKLVHFSDSTDQHRRMY